MPAAFLSDRRLMRVSGKDAENFLQNLITTDVVALPKGETYPGALLTPQGKIMFDFLIWRDGDGFIIDTAESQRDDLLKRLQMYKLRADVTLDLLDEAGVTVFWGEEPRPEAVEDMRFHEADIVVTRAPGQHGEHPVAGYHALRILIGVAESGSDFALGDAFPHDVLLDRNHGLSFTKGCYVGQEVVSRMQHRGTARRRVVMVSAESPLPGEASDLTVDGKVIGSLGSIAGRRGLALARIDRVAEAVAAGKQILADSIPVALTLPAWTGLTFPGPSEAEAEAGRIE